MRGMPSTTEVKRVKAELKEVLKEFDLEPWRKQEISKANVEWLLVNMKPYPEVIDKCKWLIVNRAFQGPHAFGR